MAQTILNNGDSGLVFRTGLNDNFTELYNGYGLAASQSVTGNVTLDFTTGQHHILTLTGNLTLDNPTTETVGQAGMLVFIQDATGSRTLTLGTQYKTVGGAGITLSTTANAIDVVPYIVTAADTILLGTPSLEFS